MSVRNVSVGNPRKSLYMRPLVIIDSDWDPIKDFSTATCCGIIMTSCELSHWLRARHSNSLGLPPSYAFKLFCVFMCEASKCLLIFLKIKLMFAVLDVAEVFSQLHIVLIQEHSLNAVFFSPSPLPLFSSPFSPLSPLSPRFATLQSWRMRLQAAGLISLYSCIMTIKKISDFRISHYLYHQPKSKSRGIVSNLLVNCVGKAQLPLQKCLTVCSSSFKANHKSCSMC